MAIFSDFLKQSVERFMVDFSFFGDSYLTCFNNLEVVFARCEETNLVFNWKKCHIMVTEGIVLGHKVSKAGLEVDEAKIDMITKLPAPANVKAPRSFLGHAATPILVASDWMQPFILMRDASDVVVGVMLEKEMLVVVFAIEKLRVYLVGASAKIYTGHLAIKFLMEKKDAKSSFIRWVLLLQEFDLKITDRKETEN
ncbi:uncharacterized protein LOC120084514 [Benincasa hispida]|uniref:uncharacterized protein LOC120084514 n=1 Tax=Benincasa hispida TaxID=102211 RepID=UPI001900BC2C|nr:uncharacterized protein LOC120084514 [Benincasa hispida]